MIKEEGREECSGPTHPYGPRLYITMREYDDHFEHLFPESHRPTEQRELQPEYIIHGLVLPHARFTCWQKQQGKEKSTPFHITSPCTEHRARLARPNNSADSRPTLTVRERERRDEVPSRNRPLERTSHLPPEESFATTGGATIPADRNPSGKRARVWRRTWPALLIDKSKIH